MSAYFYPEHYPSPRDRYYEALAQAEAAKAEYEACVAREAEMARRQQARDAYITQEDRRRNQARRAAFADYDDEEHYGYPPFGYQPRRATYQAFNQYNPAVDTYRAERLERQRKLQHARFIEEERARIRAEVEAAVEAKAKREAEARAAHLNAKRQQSIQSQQRAAQQQDVITLDQVLAQLFGQSTETQRPVRDVSAEGPRRVCQRPSGAQRPRAPAQDCCAKPVAATPAPAKVAEKSAAPELAGLEQFLSLVLGAPVKVSESATQPTPAASPSKTPSAPTPAASSSTAPNVASTSAAPSQPNLGSLKELLHKRLGSEPESDVHETLQSLFGSIFSGQSAQQAKPKGSMKEQLERRLHRDQDAETRDIELAIAESLKDAPSSPSSSKGKSPAAPTAPVINTPATSLAAINEIEAQFKTLSAAFEFPNKLDISPPSSPGAHSTSTLSRLAFTAANAPVRYYEQALSGLLSRLDAIESSGDEEVRHRRKEVVNAVETALEEVEREVETRAAMVTARDSTRSAPVPIIAEPVAPKQVEVQDEGVAQEALVEESFVVQAEDLVDVSVPASAEVAEPVAEEPVVEGYSFTPIAENVSTQAETVLKQEDSASSTTPSYPLSATDSTATITADATVEEQEPFLLAKSEPEAIKVPAHSDVDDEPVVIGDGAGSDWSEVEA